MTTQLTHKEARQLIQLSCDDGLNFHQKRALDSHLGVCADCQQYAISMRQMEAILRPLLQRQWTQQAVPLSVGALTSASHSQITHGILLATRIAAIGVMCMVFLFSAWQVSYSGIKSAGPEAESVPMIPVPSTSTQIASMTTQTQSCSDIVYIVPQGESLESISAKFSVAIEELSTANGLGSNSIVAGTKLIIPTCHFTPTANVLTTTFTPILSPSTSTPGG